MEVQIISPHSFCEGVTSSLAIAHYVLNKHKGEKVYILGDLVHSNDVIASLLEEGFILLREKDGSLEEHIASLKEGDVVIFSAHGHAPYIDELASEKGLVIYDATCRYVKKNAEIIIEELASSNEDVIYIGKEGHSEALGAININTKRITLYSENLPKNLSSSPLVVSQTTIEPIYFAKAKEHILRLYPNARFTKEMCNATRIRQEVILTADEDIDLYIILGAKESNNSKNLYLRAKEKYKNANVLLAENVKDLSSYDLSKYKKTALASGASTSPKTFEAVKDYLTSL